VNTGPLPLLDRLRGLVIFLPEFEAPDFEFGSWTPAAMTDGVMTLGFYSLGDTASKFVGRAYELGWVHGGFDWPKWAQGPRAKALRDEPEVLATAPPDDLARLLTVVVRQERFGDGSLADAYETGLLTAILRRMAALAAQTETGG